jgi:hypothetical protein
LERFCSIDNKLFKFYKDPEYQYLEGILDFDLLNCKVHAQEGSKEFTIEVLGSKERFSFQSEMLSAESWIKEINNHISMGVGKQLPALAKRMASYTDFWRIERISTNCMTYQADSGDLLLFQGNNFSGRIN